jgi:hypothetical protein
LQHSYNLICNELIAEGLLLMVWTLAIAQVVRIKDIALWFYFVEAIEWCFSEKTVLRASCK